MKFLQIVLASFSLLLYGCYQDPDDLIDENVLSELPSFEYKGYRYYVHPRLSIHTSTVSYGDIKKEVESLDSYGYDWLIPTMDEMERAIENGYVEEAYNGTRLSYMTSSKEKDGYIVWYYSYEGIWIQILDGRVSGTTVLPMIKFRK